MNASERFRAAADLFLEAGRLPPTEIDAFLRERCGPDDDLRAHVRALLDQREAPDVFETLASRLKSLGVDARSHVSAEETASGYGQGSSSDHVEEVPGQTIGRFRLVELLGEGGFGRVWVAEQSEPVRRRVALKVLKAGMDSKEILARFEAERQALAFMDHPNIAKVFDAGVTERGRPYFVMEHVPGHSITGFCDANRLRVRQRLELFVPVCRALQHAHQRGIIHRDLKPSNILVSLVDGRPAPKIIDFGIAKATAAPLTERTLVSAMGQLLGTPEYMSPEQALSAGADIDTRSDIYALGVVLYQLLTGTLPFDSKMLLKAGYEGMIRVIREQEPPKPSTRLATLMGEPSDRRKGATPNEIVRNQGTEARIVQRELRGDLDWIVMKCLEKDRERRYESADALGAEIQRYLNGEPVVAAPPSRIYQLRKLVRRNCLLIGAAGSVVSALLLGTGVSLYLYVQERDARRQAVAAEAESQTRADNLQRVADFQSEMLAQVDPTTAGLRLTEDVTAKLEAALAKADVPESERAVQAQSFASLWRRVNATDAARDLIDRTILQPAVAAIEKQFADQPVVGAALRGVLAQRYNDLGMYAVALELEQQALDARRRALGEDHPDTLVSIGNVGSFLFAQRKLSEAEPYYRDSLERSRRVLGEDNPQTLMCVSRMGALYSNQGDQSKAEPFYRETLEKRRRVLGEEHPATLTAIGNMGGLRRNQGRFAEAEALHREALEKCRRVHGDENRDTVNAINNLAAVLQDQGKAEEAVAYFREAVEIRRRILGDAHPSTLTAIQNLGTTLAGCGHRREAEVLLREALASQQRLLGADHPSTIGTLSNLAVFLIEQGDVAAAEPMCRAALESRQRVLGNNHRDTLISNNVMGYVLRGQKKTAEAEPYVRETLAIARRVLGPAHRDTLIYANNLGALLSEMGRPAEAEPLFREVIETGGIALGDENALVLIATSYLGAALVELKRPAEAVELLSKAEPTARKALEGSNERTLASFLVVLGKARTRLGQFGPAEAILLEAHAIVVKMDDAAKKDPRSCMRALVELYGAWDAAEPGAGYAIKEAEWRAKLEAIESPTSQKAQVNR